MDNIRNLSSEFLSLGDKVTQVLVKGGKEDPLSLKSLRLCVMYDFSIPSTLPHLLLSLPLTLEIFRL